MSCAYLFSKIAILQVCSAWAQLAEKIRESHYYYYILFFPHTTNLTIIGLFNDDSFSARLLDEHLGELPEDTIPHSPSHPIPSSFSWLTQPNWCRLPVRPAWTCRTVPKRECPQACRADSRISTCRRWRPRGRWSACQERPSRRGTRSRAASAGDPSPEIGGYLNNNREQRERLNSHEARKYGSPKWSSRVKWLWNRNKFLIY